MSMLKPSHPGALILESIKALSEETGHKVFIGQIAASLGVSRKTLSAIINERQNVSKNMSVRLSKAFSNTTAELWLAIQKNYTLSKVVK